MRENNFFEKKITFLGMCDTFVKRWRIVLIIMVLSVSMGILYSILNISQTYSSTAKLYIVNKEKVSSAELSVSTSLAKDLQEIIYDETTLSEVAINLENKFSIYDIKNSITVNNPDYTRVIEISATSTNKGFAQQVTESLCQILPDKAHEIMGVDRVSIISEGSVHPVSTTPSKITVIFYGFLIGIGASIIVLFLFTVFNNKISSEKEITEVLGLNVLATIPYNNKKGRR